MSGEAQAHKTLAEALLAFQAEAPKLRTNETAKVPTKSGGEYSYKYLSLDKLIDEITPILHKHGLVWASKPGGTHSEPTLRYTLTHTVSKETDEGEMPLYLGGAATAQAHGSAISYARRYAMLAALNLVAEDDDGKGASGGNRQSQRPVPQKDRVDVRNTRLLTKEERERVVAAIEAADQDPDLALAAVGLESWGDATVEHARQIKTMLPPANGATA